MENLDKKKKIIIYTSIAVLILLIISVVYFMINSKIKEKKYNDDMKLSIANIANCVVYDYSYSLDDVSGRVMMQFENGDNIVVEKAKDGTELKEGMILAKYDGKKKITINLPAPIITKHDIDGRDLKKDDLIETNKAINAAKIAIENKIMSSDAQSILTERFKLMLTEFLKAKGYNEIEFK